MSNIRSKITSQGQISVPSEIRRKLGIGPGSVIEWSDEGGEIVVRRAGRVTSEDLHRRLFDKTPSPKTLEEIREGIREHVRKRNARDRY